MNRLELFYFFDTLVNEKIIKESNLKKMLRSYL